MALQPTDPGRLPLTDRDPGSRLSRALVGWCVDLMAWVSGLWVANWGNLPVYADNAAAVTGGLAVGKPYRTATGEVRVVV